MEYERTALVILAHVLRLRNLHAVVGLHRHLANLRLRALGHQCAAREVQPELIVALHSVFARKLFV